MRSTRSLQMDLDTSGIQSLMDQLADKLDEAARPAAQAMAQVVYERVKLNVSRLGKYTGNLDSSIYQAYSQARTSALGAPTYHVSWNPRKAPHGHLVEDGHWQRYAVVRTSKGWVTAVRPEMQGQPKPKRRASPAEKDAYYVPRPGGPVYVAGKFFVRSAADAFPEARKAAEQRLKQELDKA